MGRDSLSKELQRYENYIKADVGITPEERSRMWEIRRSLYFSLDKRK